MSRSTFGLIAGLLALFFALPAAAQVCDPGDALFTELMIAPPDHHTMEWLELHLRVPCDLDACSLHKEDELGQWGDPAHLDGLCDLFDCDAEGYLLLAKNKDAVDLEGQLPAFAYASGLSLDNNDDVWLHLVCDGTTVDSAPVAWSLFADACGEPDPDDHGCSVNLPAWLEDDAEGAEEAELWCLPPEDPAHLFVEAYDGDAGNPNPYSGTPGEAGSCRTRAWPAEGKVQFTEYMIEPAGDELNDWIELRLEPDVPSAELRDCTLQRWKATGPPYEIVDDNPDAFTFGWADGPTALVAEEVLVLTRDVCLDGTAPVAGEGCPETGLPGSLVYGSVSLTTGDPGWLELVCPGTDGTGEEVIDGAWFDHALMGDPGRSWCFDPTDGGDNADVEAWIPASDDQVFLETAQGPELGTPGTAGSCLPEGAALPVRGDLHFSEVMVASTGGLPDWVELASTSEQTLTLVGCTLTRYEVDGAGSPLSNPQTTVLDGVPRIEPGGFWVLANGACTDGGDPELFDCPLINESQIQGVNFTNDRRHRLELACPGSDELVDEMTWDLDAACSDLGCRPDHSMVWDPDFAGCDGADEDCNDDPIDWCEAPFDDEYAADHYGTPGLAGSCPASACGSGDDDDATPPLPPDCGDCETGGCGCDDAGDRSRTGLWLAALVGLTLRRRRAHRGRPTRD